MNILANIVITLVTAVASAWGVYNYAPLSFFEHSTAPKLGSTITTINGTDTLSASRSVINTNFSNLNTGKFELSDWYATTSAAQLTTLANLSTVGTITSGIWSGTAITAINTATAYTWSALQTFSNASLSASFVNASSTQFSVPNTLYWGSTATSTLTSTGSIGIGTTSPFAALSLDRSAGLASSTIAVREYPYGSATSTSELIDCRSASQQHFRIGTAATALQLNASSMIPGQKCIVVVENPNASAGAITWTVSSGAILLWAAGTTPTQTTAANKIDVWSFLMTQGSSTNVILGAASVNF